MKERLEELLEKLTKPKDNELIEIISDTLKYVDGLQDGFNRMSKQYHEISQKHKKILEEILR
ncbi:MAG: hypothetical protein KGI50_05665 [Patescibacteria group bacterium]|nr:hypothetical protein [Patescibacteria group bacterium]MDE2438881.1 hypothetical protein [Patescibacteria group bacterium]